MIAQAFAPVNIALLKYWGKRDSVLNLPTHSSISVTLGNFGSTTSVEFRSDYVRDSLTINGGDIGDTSKITRVLTELRKHSSSRHFARVTSSNNFPTGAGLASSASGLCAVTLAAAKALNLDLSIDRLSAIARVGSGSATRSFFGGFVVWEQGTQDDGSDSVGRSLFPRNHWDLRVLPVITSQESKSISSTKAMELSRASSPYFHQWVEEANQGRRDFEAAIAAKSFARLASLSERNCLLMHSVMMSSTPPIVYWKPETISIVETVWDLRAEGEDVFFTIDAGPNVFVITTASSEAKIAREINSRLPNITVLQTGIGEGARII